MCLKNRHVIGHEPEEETRSERPRANGKKNRSTYSSAHRRIMLRKISQEKEGCKLNHKDLAGMRIRTQHA